MESSNLPDTELKTMVIRMLNKLRGRIDEFSENLYRDRNHKKEAFINREYNN